MITKEACKIISEDERFVTWQHNTPLYDKRGCPTWEYDDSNPDIITIVKFPLWDNPIEHDKSEKG